MKKKELVEQIMQGIRASVGLGTFNTLQDTPEESHAEISSSRKLARLARERIEQHEYQLSLVTALAASTRRTGKQGQALGIAVSASGPGYKNASDFGAGLIECDAWVGDQVLREGKLELLGRETEIIRDSINVKSPLIYLEEKLERVFACYPPLQAFDLDRRVVNVDLHERSLIEASSLSLSIIMAVLNALFQKKEVDDTVYSADVSMGGQLLGVGDLERKLEAAKRFGIRNFILPAANQSDCPSEYLSALQPKLIFFEDLQKVMGHFGLSPPHASRFATELPCAVTGEYPENRESATERPIAASERVELNPSTIQEISGSLGIGYDRLESMLTFFEDLCQSRNLKESWGTVIFVGDRKKIEAVLPDSGLRLANQIPLIQVSQRILNLSSLADGKQLALVADVDGLLRSIRRVDLEFTVSAKTSSFLSGDALRFAGLSSLTGALVFSVPYQGMHLNVFFGGEIVGKYLNGCWFRTDYRAVEKVLQQISDTTPYRRTDLKAAVRAAVAMAEERKGGTFAFLPDVDNIPIEWDNRLKSEYGLELVPLPMAELDLANLMHLAEEKGTLVIDARGNLIACHVYFDLDLIPDSEEPAMELGNRHRYARALTVKTGALAIVSSRYGTVTVYFRGNIVCKL